MLLVLHSHLALVFVSGLVWLQVAYGSPQHTKCPTDVEGVSFGLHCYTPTVQARVPPFINPNPKRFASWRPPPLGYLFGNWKVTYTSQSLYLTSFRNMQGDSYPAFPANASLPGQTNDVTSFQQPNSSTIITSYGIDTPRRSSDTRLGLEWEAVFDFQGVGAMSTTNNSWAVLAWGYDTCGIPYFVAYESEIADINDPPGLVIHSRSDQGPTKETLAEIFSSLRAVGNKEITALVEQTKPTIQDGERRGQAPVVCNDACVNNTIYSA